MKYFVNCELQAYNNNNILTTHISTVAYVCSQSIGYVQYRYQFMT